MYPWAPAGRRQATNIPPLGIQKIKIKNEILELLISKFGICFKRNISSILNT
jgi:hypothetical protein